MEAKVDDIVWFQNFKENYRGEISRVDLKKIASMHSIYFGHSYHVPCGCKSGLKTIKQWVQELDTYLLTDAD